MGPSAVCAIAAVRKPPAARLLEASESRHRIAPGRINGPPGKRHQLGLSPTVPVFAKLGRIRVCPIATRARRGVRAVLVVRRSARAGLRLPHTHGAFRHFEPGPFCGGPRAVRFRRRDSEKSGLASLSPPAVRERLAYNISPRCRGLVSGCAARAARLDGAGPPGVRGPAAASASVGPRRPDTAQGSHLYGAGTPHQVAG